MGTHAEGKGGRGGVICGGARTSVLTCCVTVTSGWAPTVSVRGREGDAGWAASAAAGLLGSARLAFFLF